MDTPTVLHRLRLHLPPGTPPAEGAACRRHAESALAAADLRPAGLPAGAVLIVRRLPDPLPGALWDGQPWQSGTRWGASARAALTELWRGAARPALGAVPADARAVWFADHAEWLACLSLDLAAGARRWWWERWLTGAPLRLAALWREQARWLPAALALVRAGGPGPLAALAAQLAPTESAAVRAALVAAHALPAALATTPIPPADEPTLVPGPPLPLVAAHAHDALALALALHHAPEALRAWAADANVAPPPPPPAPRASPDPGAASHLHALAPAAQRPPAAPAPTEQAAPPVASAPGTARPIPPAAAPPHPLAATAGQQAAQRLEQGPPPPNAVDDQTHGGPIAPLTAARAEAAPAIASELGGAWYLVNALEALGWLDEPGAAGPSPWLRLAALARALLDGAPPASDGSSAAAGDPLWAPFDGAPPAPDDRWAPGDDPLWAPFDGAPPAPDDRWAPGDDPLWALLDELAGLPDDRAARAEAHAAAGAWLAARGEPALTWLAARLPALADDPARRAALLRGAAQIRHSRTHVDVWLSLEQISLDARLAGLDRDPGWVPHLQRVIGFHFV